MREPRRYYTDTGGFSDAPVHDTDQAVFCTDDPAYLEMKRSHEAMKKLEGMARNGGRIRISDVGAGHLSLSWGDGETARTYAPSLVEAVEQVEE